MAGIGDILRRRGPLAWLVGVNALVFMVMAVLAVIHKAGGPSYLHAALAVELPAQVEVWSRRPWTLLTYMFVHENFLHLLFNMLWLLWFGDILTRRIDNRRLVWLYIGGGLAGGVLYMLCYRLFPGFYSGGALLLGASASVLAIMTAAAVLMPGYTLHLFFLGDVKLKWIAVAMIALAFLGLGGGNAAGEIAHIGGVAYGLAAARLMRHPDKVKAREPKRRNPFKGMEQDMRRFPAHNAEEREKMESRRLDELLDKIHTSGFNSLTRRERAELEELSRKVTK